MPRLLERFQCIYMYVEIMENNVIVLTKSNAECIRKLDTFWLWSGSPGFSKNNIASLNCKVTTCMMAKFLTGAKMDWRLIKTVLTLWQNAKFMGQVKRCVTGLPLRDVIMLKLHCVQPLGFQG